MATLHQSADLTRVLDIESTLDNLGGDATLLKEVLAYYVELTPQQLDDLATVIAAGDADTACLQAHGLKGGASNVGAVGMAETARQLEMLAKSGTLDGADAYIAKLRADFEVLQGALAQLDWSLFT